MRLGVGLKTHFYELTVLKVSGLVSILKASGLRQKLITLRLRKLQQDGFE